MLLRTVRAPARTIWSRSSSIRPGYVSGGLRSHPSRFLRWGEGKARLFTSVSIRRQDLSTDSNVDEPPHDALLADTETRERARGLPVACPGCGALSQTVDPDAAGFYGPKRAKKAQEKNTRRQEEDEVYNIALRMGRMGALSAEQEGPKKQSTGVPICDRCHGLRYQSRGTGIIHPSMQSIQDIIEESPHKNNHIYHVIDAADFPMSVIPNLTTALNLPRLRTQNRRSKSMHYIRGRKAEVSFIITRSDLLAPKKEQVDSMVPYLREVLRDSLGRSGRDVRLGNVRCVSAQRGWWTKTVKEDIWTRGGAGWMVGKVNVGKSALYEVVFPKGRNNEGVNVREMRRQEEQKVLQDVVAKLDERTGERYTPTTVESTVDESSFADSPGELGEATLDAKPSDPEAFQESILETNESKNDFDEDDAVFDEKNGASLLPPAQKETAYPNMPLVSSLPGTTASPIRIPFGNGKGELIDLPGIHRSSLDTYVKDEFQKQLMMKSRVVPEQYTVKPGQSILIGGMIRITPKTDDLIFLAYPFVPLQAHVTGNDKAVAIQTGIPPDGGIYTGNVESVSTDEAKQTIKKAGTFQLSWDVTKRRTGALTDKAAGKQKAANLPFIVYSADILIEGVGWVELTCQVRSRQKSFITETVSDAFGEETVRKEVAPEVEVWSPEGKFVGMRRPMNAWVIGGPKKTPVHLRRSRPRHSVSYQRRMAGGAKGGKKVVVEND